MFTDNSCLLRGKCQSFSFSAGRYDDATEVSSGLGASAFGRFASARFSETPLQPRAEADAFLIKVIATDRASPKATNDVPARSEEGTRGGCCLQGIVGMR